MGEEEDGWNERMGGQENGRNDDGGERERNDETGFRIMSTSGDRVPDHTDQW